MGLEVGAATDRGKERVNRHADRQDSDRDRGHHNTIRLRAQMPTWEKIGKANILGEGESNVLAWSRWPAERLPEDLNNWMHAASHWQSVAAVGSSSALP